MFVSFEWNTAPSRHARRFRRRMIRGVGPDDVREAAFCIRGKVGLHVPWRFINAEAILAAILD